MLKISTPLLLDNLLLIFNNILLTFPFFSFILQIESRKGGRIMKLCTGIKKILKIASVVFTALWIVLIYASIVEKQNYSNPTTEPLDYYFSYAIYNVFIAVGITGIFSSGILTLCIYTFSSRGQEIKDIYMWFTYFVGMINNVIFYMFWYGLFYQNSYFTLLPPLVWIISWIICLGLLINRWIEKLVHKIYE